MADKWPLANGNWSNAANWNGGTKPVPGDDVYADGRTVTVDEDVNIGTGTLRTQQRSGGTTGGGFNLNANISVTANIVSGTSTCVSASAAGTNTINGDIVGGVSAIGVLVTSATNFVVNGNVTGGVSGSSPYGINFTSTGTLTIVGNLIGGTTGYGAGPVAVGINLGGGIVNIVGNLQSAGGIALYVQQPCTVVVTGNVTGSSVNSSAGLSSTATGSTTITINGTVTGGSAASSNGLLVSNNGNVTINGTVTGGSASNAEGARMNGSGTIQINGTVIGGTGSSGAFLAGTGTIRATRAKGNDYGPGSVGITAAAGISGSVNTGLIEVDELEFGSRGMAPVSWYAVLRPLTSNICIVRDTSVNAKTLVDPSTVGDYPANANVRLGTQFNFGNNTGTLAVPNPNQVAVGIATDNTIGTAVITEASLLPFLQQALSPNSPIAVERSIDDEKSITFSWPVSGATIAGEKSVDNAAYSAVTGGISFLRTESGRHYYTLAYNAADRVNEESTIRYKMTDGTYTRYFNLRLVHPGITPQQIEDQLEDEFNAVNTNVAAVGLAVVARPTLSEIEASTVLAKESNATSNKEEILIVANDSIEKLNQIQASSDNQDEVIEDLALEETVQNIKSILTSEENPDKVMVNQDFGGADNLMYTLDGEPVADALIELFLYSDYTAGNYNSNRIDSTRQRIDGTWAKAFYLDPQEYVVRFYRTGVAGPDAFKLVVSFDADEIDITPL